MNASIKLHPADAATTGNGPFTTVKGACPHDCPDTCALETTVQDGRAIKVAGSRSHPFTDGVLCTKVSRYLERTYSDQRVLHPMRRIGRKGEGRFARISWDEALDEIAARFKAIAASADGPESIVPYSYAGTMGYVQSASMDRRFFNRMGASLLDRTICASAGAMGGKATLGASIGSDAEAVVDARLIIIWGSNPIVSNLHFWTRVQEARRNGAHVVAIDPYRSETAQKCDEHIALLPGTDGALALAMMHVLIAEDRLDRDYIARYTLGFEQLAERVRDYPPAKVAVICGISEDTIVRLARDYAGTRPAMIRLNYGMQRHAGGGMAVRTVACLPALTGSWREAAGGLLISASGAVPLDGFALERPDLRPSKSEAPRVVNMSAIGDALLDATPPIRALYVYNSNPVAVAPESNKVIAGFSREDLFCVVHEIFQTDTADYADILLPATTQLEHFDVHGAYGHYYALANNPAIVPLGEAKPNSEVFRLLSKRMGFTDACLFDSDEQVAAAAFRWNDPLLAGRSFEDLKRDGWLRYNVPNPWAPYAEGGFRTPSGKCEFYSAWLEKQGHDPLPFYTPPAESVQSSPRLAQKFPLAFISPPARNALNSSFANLAVFLDAEKEPAVELHDADAAARGIQAGDMLRVFNDRGAFTARARLSGRSREGVVTAPSLWWRKIAGGNANDVTSQRLTDFGGGATFYDCLVEVEKAG